MTPPSLYIAGTGSSFPAPFTTASAIERGLYSQAFLDRSDQLAATVAQHGQAAPTFAAEAAREALGRSGHAPDDVALLVYTLSGHCGIHLWNSAAYIQNVIGMTESDSMPIEVRSGCAGATVSLQLAAAMLAAEDRGRVAVVTTGDVWPDDVYDRWRADPGVVYGDGGTAVVLSQDTGWARVLALGTRSDGSLEGLNRGREPFGSFRHSVANPINPKRRGEQWFADTMSKDEMWQRRDDGVQRLVARVCKDAGVQLQEIEHVVPQFLGSERLEREFLAPLGLDRARTTWEFGRTVGHLGTGDPFAGLNHLAETDQLRAGEHFLLIGVGAGFVWSATVGQVLERPTTTTTQHA